MPVIKIHISYEDSIELKEAARFYGLTLDELYKKMAHDYIDKIRGIDDESRKPKMAERVRGRWIDFISVIAYRRVYKKRMKERNGRPADVIALHATESNSVRGHGDGSGS